MKIKLTNDEVRDVLIETLKAKARGLDLIADSDVFFVDEEDCSTCSFEFEMEVKNG